MAQRDMPLYDDTYRTRLNRVLAWRDGFSKSSAAPSGGGEFVLLSYLSFFPTPHPQMPIRLTFDLSLLSRCPRIPLSPKT